MFFQIGKSMSTYGNEQADSLLTSEMESPVTSGTSASFLKSSSSHLAAENAGSSLTIANSATVQHDPSSAMSIGKRLFANLIPSTAYQPLKMPYAEDEHYLLSSDSVFYINDKYLSSIVAFTLR